MNLRTTAVLFGMIVLFCIVSCKQQGASQKGQQNTIDTIPQRDYLSLIISLDTLTSPEYKEAILREDSLLRHVPDSSTNPFYHFFRGKRLSQQKLGDSAVRQFQQMTGDSEVELLKSYSILDQRIRNGMTVEGELMSQILSTMKTAERLQSKITYQLYDLMAKAYYQNENANESLEYAERYYTHHPYRLHPVVMQRHYDISFLLSSRLNDFDKMMLSNVEARNFARQIHDSLAIARTYDNEAQIFSRQGQNEKALASSKIYFSYLARTNNLNDIAYNNMATSFLRNRQLDSAIRYYREAISFAQKNAPGKKSPVYFKGLIEALKKNGEYVEALKVAESAYQTEINNIKRIEAVKFAEIHERYETEKKDRNIEELSNRNELNEKVIRQQRWMLVMGLVVFVGALLFFYFMHRQYRLKEKNRLLQSENKRLNMEQKLLQAQLNPHFIFNSIANLQSLIASGDTRESVRYLSAFSGLLRNVLEQSRRDFIGLDEEIVTLEHYLQLNQMRFAGLFDYWIHVDKQLYPENTLIPPMLIQPFVENAIEHGFRNINYKGVLTISFAVKNGQMFITVEDNGKGLTAKEPNEQKKQSLAGTILKERLEVLFKSQGQEAKYEIADKKDSNGQGVIIHIVIPEIKD
ncbi:histidine kinase [Chitinophaga arvensicola]|uniref:Histidine kinase n=1 Tax=Chitinophaga arvensicola TaxID=29529 RepID=A0A1I0SDV1_9BACT|nr:histidine kinase [Chitinophaga arvensicola]SEW56371.1 Histidine kinase [Chitinophaga arvensicola]